MKAAQISHCFLIILVTTAAGCTTVGSGMGGLFLGESGPAFAASQQAIPPDVPTATIVMAATDEAQVAAQLPLNEVTYVQGALEKTGLTKRFRRMKLELFRTTESGKHRMEIRFDREKGRVDPRYDYALHPGDQLVVSEDNATVLDDMLDSLTNALN